MTSFWIPKQLDLKIAAQLKSFEENTQIESNPFVTISRAYGCDGMDFANRLIDELNKVNDGWYLFQRKMLTTDEGLELAGEHIQQLDKYGYSEFHSYIREALFGMPNQRETIEKLGKIIYLLAKAGKVVFLGGGGALFTRSLSNGVHIRYNASLEWRVDHHREQLGDKPDGDQMDLHQKVLARNNEREGFIKTYLGENICSLEHYDLVFNNQKINVDQATHLTLELLKIKGYLV